MKIRQAKLSDLSEIKSICSEENFEPGRNWEGLIKSKESEIYVLADKNRIVGFTGLIQYDWNNTLQVTNVFIVPEFRRKGLGSKLIEFILDKVKTTKYRCLIAEAPSMNPVVKLYKKLGFRKCGYNDRYYSNSGKEIAFWMCYDLK